MQSFNAADLDRPTMAVASSPTSENVLIHYSEPTILKVTDLGDEDAYLWEVEVAYLTFRATAVHRDRSAAQIQATERVLAKAKQK